MRLKIIILVYCVVGLYTGFGNVPEVSASASEKKTLKILNKSLKAPANSGIRYRKKQNIELPGKPVTKSAVKEAIVKYFNEHPDEFGGLKLNQIKEHYVAEIPAVEDRPGMVYVQFVQLVDGLEVKGTFIQFSVKLLKDRSILMGHSIQVFPEISLSKGSEKSLDFIDEKAKEALLIEEDAKPIRQDWTVRYIEGKWRKIYEAGFDPNSPYHALVDTETGESWAVDTGDHLNLPAITGNVTARGVRFDPLNTPVLDTLILRDLKIEDTNGNVAYTDEFGHFDLGPASSSAHVIVTLEGKWAKVISCAGEDADLDTCLQDQDELRLDAIAQPGQPLGLLFNPIGNEEFETAQVNGYYHATLAYQWFRERMPQSFDALDTQLVVFVNGSRTACGGIYLSPEAVGQHLIAFTSAANCVRFDVRYQSINWAFDTIIYHEYTHFVDELAGGKVYELDDGIIEGISNLFTMYISGQPLMAENVVEKEVDGVFVLQPYLLTGDNAFQYGQEEEWGEALPGFGWHLRENLIASLGEQQGIAVAEDLMTKAIIANSHTIPDFVSDTLWLDDDDGDLANGTPHAQEIILAAQYHNIPVDDSILPGRNIIINNNSNFTNSAFVNLNILAPNVSPVIVEMRISNTNPVDWSSIPKEAYATTKSWTLTSGDGNKTVYIQFKNATGFWSPAFKDTILLDTTRPAAIVSTLGATTATTVRLNAITSDPEPSSKIDKIVYTIRKSNIDTNLNSMLYAASSWVTNTDENNSADFATSTDVAKSWFGTAGIVYTVTGYDKAGNALGSAKYWYDKANGVLKDPDLAAPNVPAGLTVSNGATAGTANLSWDPSPDYPLQADVNNEYVNYKIYRNGVLIKSTARILRTAGQKVTYTDTNLVAGIQYSYQVLARDMWSKESAKCAPFNFTLDPLAPTVPTGLQANQYQYAFSDGYRAQLTWGASTVSGSGTVSYEIYRNDVKVGTTTSTTYMDTKLAETTYYYKVRAVANTNHYSGYSNTASVTLVN